MGIITGLGGLHIQDLSFAGGKGVPESEKTYFGNNSIFLGGTKYNLFHKYYNNA